MKPRMTRQEHSRADIAVNPYLDFSTSPNSSIESRGNPPINAAWALDALDLTSDGILMVDNEGAIRFANCPAESLFGWERGELVGQGIDQIVPELPRFSPTMWTEENAGQPVHAKGRRKDGSEFDLQILRCPLDGASGTHCLYLMTDITETLNNELQTQLHEQRFDLLFRAFPVPAYVWQRQGEDFVLIDYNDADQYYTNSAIRRFLHRKLSYMYPEGGPIVEDIERCYREKAQFTREISGYRLRSTNEVKDLIVTYVPLEPDRVVAIIENVTAEHATLSELKKLSNAVKQTADAVFITDRNGVIEYVNPAFEQITGYPRAKAIGNTPRILKSGQNSLEYYQRLWATILSGKPFRAQTTNRKRSGELFVVEQTITPMKDASGKITYFVSVLKDITERIHLQEVQTELRIASSVQQQLFPKQAPQIEGYDIAGAVFPAKATSGDYFDFIHMPDNTLGIVVADVCEHGMGPALIMTEARAFLRSITRHQTDPGIILSELNALIHPDLESDNNFITTFFARLEPRQNQFAWSNAGNWPCYILNEEGELVRELRTDGFPIGLFPELDLRRSDPLTILPGYCAVFLTDGIPESVNPSMQMYGEQRALDVIRRHIRGPAEAIIQHVREDVKAFEDSAEQFDDHTIVIVKRTLRV